MSDKPLSSILLSAFTFRRLKKKLSSGIFIAAHLKLAPLKYVSKEFSYQLLSRESNLLSMGAFSFQLSAFTFLANQVWGKNTKSLWAFFRIVGKLGGHSLEL
jgi:hypothetical protein